MGFGIAGHAMSFIGCAEKAGHAMSFIGFFCICCSKICKIERNIIYLQPETIKIEDYGNSCSI